MGPRTMANAGHDVLAHMGFPAAHRAKLHSTNPIGRLNGEIKRCTGVVGIFPNEQAITVRRMAGPSAPSSWSNPKNGPSSTPAT
jgi:transposase-like protein